MEREMIRHDTQAQPLGLLACSQIVQADRAIGSADDELLAV
jgi:hypothetical protein